MGQMSKNNFKMSTTLYSEYFQKKIIINIDLPENSASYMIYMYIIVNLIDL